MRLNPRAAIAAALVIFLAGCAESRLLIHTAKRIGGGDAEQAQEGYFKIGNPYQINGIWYYPAEDYEYDETGIASWYGAQFHGKTTANGETYDMNALTAAHRTLPMPSFVRVTNLENGRSLVLRLNDRGPFAKGRIIDVSRRGAQLLGFQRQGTARVRVQILADKSRAVAARMQNRDELARVGSPITVDKLPKASVEAADLPAPGGAAPSASRVGAPSTSPNVISMPPSPTTRTVASDISPTPLPRATATNTGPPQVAVLDSGNLVQIDQTAVQPTSIFVQAGAFGVFENANKVKARLSTMENVFMDRVLVNGRDLYRVRVGPLAGVSQADQILETVVATGFPDARIIVD
jgi:rare lipoprotein A